VLTDRALRDRMKERGYQQAAKFSWEVSVRRILDAYYRVAGGGSAQTGQQWADRGQRMSS